jgi:hypothetical protein
MEAVTLINMVVAGQTSTAKENMGVQQLLSTMSKKIKYKTTKN